MHTSTDLLRCVVLCAFKSSDARAVAGLKPTWRPSSRFFSAATGHRQSQAARDTRGTGVGQDHALLSDKEGREAGVGGGAMSREYSINLSVQRVLSLWVQGTVPKLQHCTEMWYWVFLWCLFSSLFVHGAVGLLMCVMLQRHKRGRLITLVLISAGFISSVIGGVLTSAVVAWVYRVAGKDMAPLEALVFGVGQTTLTILISFSRILATL